MAVKQLYPNQRPTLNLNFARSKILDPRITWTRNSIATYVGSDGLIKTAAAHEPRFGYHPTTLESLGLMMESGDPQHVQYSEAFNNAYWTNDGNNITFVTGQTAPDGSSNAIKFTNSGGGERLYKQNVYTHGTSADRRFVFSIFGKWAGTSGSTLKLKIVMSITGTVECSWNLNTGEVVDGSNTGTGAKILQHPNGWYRLEFNKQGSNNDVVDIEIITEQSDIILWGAQFENKRSKNYASSYIPTSGSTLSRVEDSCGMVPAADWRDGLSVGTVFCKYYVLGRTAYGSVWRIGYSPDISWNGQPYNSESQNGPVKIQGNASSALSTPNGLFKPDVGVIGYSSGDSAYCLNGGSIRTSSNAISTPNSSTSLITSNQANWNNKADGFISQFVFWPQRLTNDQIKDLSRMGEAVP